MIDGYGRLIIGEILDAIGRVFRVQRFICKKQDFTEMVAGKGFKYFLTNQIGGFDHPFFMRCKPCLTVAFCKLDILGSRVFI